MAIQKLNVKYHRKIYSFQTITNCPFNFSNQLKFQRPLYEIKVKKFFFLTIKNTIVQRFMFLMSEGDNWHDQTQIQHLSHPQISHTNVKHQQFLDIAWFHNAIHYMWNMIHFSFSYLLSLISSTETILVSLFNFAPEEALFEDGDDFADLFGSKRGGDKFLGVYSKEEITTMIRNSPMAEKISQLGYPDWEVDFDLSDCFQHYGYIRSQSLRAKDAYLAFIICQVGDYQFPNDIDILTKKLLTYGSRLNMLNIRWFSLQNPKGHFTPERPRLPGQKYPGTGLAKDAFLIFHELAERNHRDGIVNVPEHFHNAYGYKNFLFLNPYRQGAFLKLVHELKADIHEKGLAMVSWAIYLGYCYYQDSPNQTTFERQYKWDPSDQIFPISKRTINYFTGAYYKIRCKSTYEKSPGFKIDWEGAEKQCLWSILHYSDKENQMTSQ